MAAERKNKGSIVLDLQQQHKEIVSYLRSRFRQFIKSQSQDFDPRGDRRPTFKENSKAALIKFFETTCDSFGRSYRALQEDKKLKDPAETTRNGKRLNLFLAEFCREHGIDQEHPIQLFTQHQGTEKIYQVHLHFACARTGFDNRNKSYSADNITLKQAIENGKAQFATAQEQDSAKTQLPSKASRSHVDEFREKLKTEAIEHINEKLHNKGLDDFRDLDLELGLVNNGEDLFHAPKDHNRQWRKFNHKKDGLIKGVYILSSETGSGKTTFLRSVQIKLIENTDFIPLFFEATELADCNFRKRNLHSFLKGISGLLEGYLPDECEDFLQRHHDKVLFLVDGLDQITGSGTEYKNLIDKLLGVLKDKLIIASRPFAVVDKEKDSSISFLRLAPFTENDVKAYFSENYQRAIELCRRCSDMLYIPMLAYMVRLLIEEGLDENINNRTGLYKAFTDYIFENYSHDNLEMSESQKTKIRAAYEELSYNAIANDEIYLQKIPLDFAVSCIPKDIDIDDLLKYGLAHIILNRTAGVSKFIYFSHQSVQEFFAAQWASKCEKRINHVLSDGSQWHSTMVFLAGIKGESIFKQVYDMWLDYKTNHLRLSYAFELCEEINKLEQYREVILKDIMHVLGDLKTDCVVKGMQCSVIFNFFGLFVELDNYRASQYVLDLIREYLTNNTVFLRDYIATLMFNYIPFFSFTGEQMDELFEASLKIYRDKYRPWEFDDIVRCDGFGQKHVDQIIDHEFQNAATLSESKIPPLFYFRNTASKIRLKHLDKICDLMNGETDNDIRDRILLILSLYPYAGKLKHRHVLSMIGAIYSDGHSIDNQVLESFLVCLFNCLEKKDFSKATKEINRQKNAFIKEVGFRVVEIWDSLVQEDIISCFKSNETPKTRLSGFHELALKYILLLTVKVFSQKVDKTFSREIQRRQKTARRNIEDFTVSYRTCVSAWSFYC